MTASPYEVSDVDHSANKWNSFVIWSQTCFAALVIRLGNSRLWNSPISFLFLRCSSLWKVCLQHWPQFFSSRHWKINFHEMKQRWYRHKGKDACKLVISNRENERTCHFWAAIFNFPKLSMSFKIQMIIVQSQNLFASNLMDRHLSAILHNLFKFLSKFKNRFHFYQ